jgi:molybdopterin molybdotransferase
MVFILPVIRHLQGVEPFQRNLVKAALEKPVESDGRESYLRCRLEKTDSGYTTSLTGHQGSGNLYALTRANALLFLPSGVKSLPAGSMVDVWLLDEFSS